MGIKFFGTGASQLLVNKCAEYLTTRSRCLRHSRNHTVKPTYTFKREYHSVISHSLVVVSVLCSEFSKGKIRTWLPSPNSIKRSLNLEASIMSCAVLSRFWVFCARCVRYLRSRFFWVCCVVRFFRIFLDKYTNWLVPCVTIGFKVVLTVIDLFFTSLLSSANVYSLLSLFWSKYFSFILCAFQRTWNELLVLSV